jgi:hypothetical protein
MVWWVLAVFGVTILVLQWMIFRRQFAFIVAGLLLIVGGGLGIGGVWQDGTNPLEQAIQAIRRQFPGVIPPSAPPNAPFGVTPLPEAPAGSSAAPSTAPATPPSSVTPEPPSNPSPTPPASPEPANPPASPTEPPTSPAPTNPAAERHTLEVNSNLTLAIVRLERADGQRVGSSGIPAKFEDLEPGVYTLVVESPGSKGFRGTVNVPQSKTVTVYLEK